MPIHHQHLEPQARILFELCYIFSELSVTHSGEARSGIGDLDEYVQTASGLPEGFVKVCREELAEAREGLVLPPEDPFYRYAECFEPLRRILERTCHLNVPPEDLGEDDLPPY